MCKRRGLNTSTNLHRPMQRKQQQSSTTRRPRTPLHLVWAYAETMQEQHASTVSIREILLALYENMLRQCCDLSTTMGMREHMMRTTERSNDEYADHQRQHIEILLRNLDTTFQNMKEGRRGRGKGRRIGHAIHTYKPADKPAARQAPFARRASWHTSSRMPKRTA